MIKINLLPAHILERQRVKSVIPLVIIILLIQAGVLAVLYTRTNSQLADRKTELEYWQRQAAAVGAVNGEAAASRGQADGFRRWTVWKNRIDTYHDGWGTTWMDIAKYIYAKVKVDAISPNPGGVSITGATDSLASFKKSYLTLVGSPLYGGNVTFSISGVTGGWVPPVIAGKAGAPAPAAAAPGMSMENEEDRKAARLAGGPMLPQFGGPAATTAAPAQQQAALPYGLVFNCQWQGDYGQKLIPDLQPPVAGGAPGGGAVAGAGPGGPPTGGPPGVPQLPAHLMNVGERKNE